MTEDEIVVVLDAEALGERLGGAEPAWPDVSYARVVVAVTPALLAAVERLLVAEGKSGGEAAAAVTALRRRCRVVGEPGGAEVYAASARDYGLRLAVAAGARYYVSADPDITALGEWKGIRILPSYNDLVRELLSREETAPAYRAASEWEAARAAEALEAAAIDYYVAPQQVPWYDGVLVMGQGYWGEIVVFRRDLERARRAIREALGGE